MGRVDMRGKEKCVRTKITKVPKIIEFYFNLTTFELMQGN